MTPNNESSDESGEQSLHEIPLSLDAVLDILANHRRRFLLEYLWDKPENSGSFEEATEHTILKIGKRRGVQPNHDDIQVDLQHHHLPKMADAGVIDYDIRSQTIRYHENERLETAYERVNDLTVD
ncbi:DUF7344 domain-containing protein [Natrarchaeobius chitinivorans]|uniref:DUF7344 domain-containing protein n=1 Tax=Natrarchaeobius chitinivorans TaxID=1679083 RepID=UPI000F540D00|nr:hypothetical protein [Natrarchaeobius chitinivorans]